MLGLKDKLGALVGSVFSWHFPVFSILFDSVDEWMRKSVTISLDELVNQISEKTGDVIDHICREEALRFVGGVCEIQCSEVVSDGVFIAHLKLYFQAVSNDGYVLKEKSKIFPLSKLNEDSQEVLISKSVISYDINA
jgi:hypothetical protein